MANEHLALVKKKWGCDILVETKGSETCLESNVIEVSKTRFRVQAPGEKRKVQRFQQLKGQVLVIQGMEM